MTIALKEPDTRGLSDNQIAKICRVSQPFVSKIRHLLTNNGYKLGRTRLTADGRKMNVSKIGKKKKVVSGPIEPVKEKESAGKPPLETDLVTNLQDSNPGGSGDNTPKEETPAAGQTSGELSTTNPDPGEENVESGQGTGITDPEDSES